MNRKKIGIGLLILLFAIQLIRIDKTNPPLELSQDFIAIENPEPEIAQMIKDACYDCHSHKTSYPWYSNVAPVSWMLKSHIKGGRQHLNYSMWASYSDKEKEHHYQEMKEVIELKRMPMKSYTFMHSKAKLSESQKASLLDWFQSKI